MPDDVKPPLARRPDENERAHRAMLVWAMLAPEHRSQRATSIAMGCSDNAIRKWRVKHEWDQRVPDPETNVGACADAVAVFRGLYHARLGGEQVNVIRERLGAPYPDLPDAEKSVIARGIDLYDKVEREAERKRYNDETRDRNKRVKMVLDATMVRLGQALTRDDVKVTVRDLPHVLRGYELLEGSEVRRLMMLPDPAEEDTESSSKGEPLATSQRVLQAKSSGGDVLAAMIEDAEELVVILRTLREHETSSNMSGKVVPLRREATSG